MALANLIALTQPQVLRLAVDDLYRGVTAEKLGRYALILLGIAVVAGVFKLLHAPGGDRHLAPRRVRPAQRPLRAPRSGCRSPYFQRARTGDLMSRATNDLAAVRMMLGPGIMYLVNTVGDGAGLAGVHARDQPAAHRARAAAAAARLAHGVVLRRPHPPPLRGDPGALRRALGARAGEPGRACAWCAPSRARSASSRTSRALNREYLERNLAADPHLGAVLPDARVPLRARRRCSCSTSAGARSIARPHHARPVRGVHRLPRHAELADGGARLGDQPVPARHRRRCGRIVEILDAPPRDREPRPGAGAPGRRRAAARSSSATSRSPTRARRGRRCATSSFRVPAGPHRGARRAAPARGKSTLLALLAAPVRPAAGHACSWTARTCASYDLALRCARSSAVVPQDTFLFSATVAENIAYGVAARATARPIERAARRRAPGRTTCAASRRATTPWSASAASRSRAASGSARRIARAVLRDAPVLLLDDCLSSVDTHTEEAILHGLRGEMRGRTTLIVSHRVSTVRDADLIVVLEDGAVVERGTHERAARARRPLRRARTARSSSKRSSRPRDARHEEEAAGRAYDHRLMRRLLGYLRPYRGQVAARRGGGAGRRRWSSSPARGSPRRRSTTASATATSCASTRWRCSTWRCCWSASASATCRTRSCSASGSTS